MMWHTYNPGRKAKSSNVSSWVQNITLDIPKSDLTKSSVYLRWHVAAQVQHWFHDNPYEIALYREISASLDAVIKEGEEKAKKRLGENLSV